MKRNKKWCAGSGYVVALEARFVHLDEGDRSTTISLVPTV